ncbi:MAG: cation:proton antiporter [Vicinamibacteria bacterium]
MTNAQIAGTVFLELCIVLAACRAAGYVATRFRQPPVIGEMIAGVLLGPSLFGALAPAAHAWLFPREALTVLYCAAQVGLVLYMFLVGLEFDLELVRGRFKSAAAVSASGIVVPMALGAALAWHLHGDAALFPPGVQRWHAMVFVGVAMSITAFPVLARMIYEAGLTGTSLGTLTLAAGACDDALAWCLLALVLAASAGSPAVALWAVLGGLALFLAARGPLRALLRAAADRWDTPAAHDRWALPGALVLLFLTAWTADAIGIHSVFGAFVLGLSMPRGAFRDRIHPQLAPLTSSLLVPLFFAYSGLHTRIAAIGSWPLVGQTLLILLVAFAGKGLACYAAARACGEAHREAFAIGALMNARGLTELVVLNIGRERGLIGEALFSMMVIMAVTTTVTAMPAFAWAFERPRGAPRAA